MKNLVIFIVFLVVSFKVVAQQSAIVSYKTQLLSYPIDTTKVTNKKVLDMMKNEVKAVKKGLNFLDFKLKFNKNNSVFFAEIPLQRDNGINLNNVVLFLDSDGIYYKDDEVSVKQVDFNSQTFNIEQPTNFKWKIHAEENNILGYKVIKATTQKKLHNGDFLDVVAWFAPELPFQYGVKEYNGLPGVILLLKEDSIEYKAINIVFKNKLQIEKLQMKSTISQEKFDNIVKNYYGKNEK